MSATWRAEKNLGLFGNSNSKEHYIFKLYVCKTRFFLNRSWTVPARTRGIYKNILPHPAILPYPALPSADE